MPTVAISSDFLKAFSSVARDKQKKVREFTEKFRTDPTMASINYEPIKGMKDPKVRTVRIGKDYRAIVIHPEKGDVYMLVWVDHHDEAMAWAKNKVFDVNSATGAIQIVDVEEIEELVKKSSPPPQTDTSVATASDASPRLFKDCSDEDLIAVGLPKLLIPSVRGLVSETQLDALRDYFPEEAHEALFHLACGSTVEETLREVSAVQKRKKIDSGDFAKALTHPDSKRRFRVVESTEELLDMLNAPLEQWRIFLHPAQEDLVRRHFNGPARVLGGAGTGKTVVAMHRARYLAKEVFNAPNDRILFTTFTRNLARNIESLLKSLCGDEIERIEVVNLHTWAVRLMDTQDIKFRVATEEQRNECWQDAFDAVDCGKWDKPFFMAEWDQVVQAHGITSYEDYRSVPRIGRGTRLARSDKKVVWEVFDEYRRSLRRRDLVEWVDVIRETRQYMEQHQGMSRYRAVVVDEAQDLHPEDWRLIAEIAPSEGDNPNNLFIVGDAHQRIYGRKVILSHYGIDIRGRSKRLKVNYRTTEEIRSWAVALLDGVEVDDLDGGKDSVVGYKSIRNGERPDIHLLSTPAEENTLLLKRIGELSNKYPPEEICLVARTNKQVKKYAETLENAGIPHTRLDRNTDTDQGEGIRLATMHRVKGLEFSHMILAGVDADTLPQPNTAQLPENEAEAQERALLFVSATRAKNGLTVTAAGKMSRLL